MEAPSPPLHIAMYPWIAMGHIIPYLHLSNKLASRGHKVSIFIPKSTLSHLHHLNLHPHLITFIPISLPPLSGLPPHAETTSHVPFSSYPLLMTSMDLTRKHLELLLLNLKPHILLFDFAFWVPDLTRRLNIKSVQFWITNPATTAYLFCPERFQLELTEADLMKPPSGFPCSSIIIHPHEARVLAASRKWEFGSGVLLGDRFSQGLSQSDAIGFKGCREIEGAYVEYLETQFNKPILLSGPLIPNPPTSSLDEKWVSWLGGFKKSSVIYCAFGSESPLQKSQVQELLLGLELTGNPFLAALKPPMGHESIESALPEGFEERVRGRGVVYGGWVQQELILGHPCVGCFVTHCGAGSLTEGLVSECGLVLLPRLGGDHIVNARVMGEKLKVGVEVERGEEDGEFSRESVCKAVRIVMDEGSEVGREVRANHAKLRWMLMSEDLEKDCIDGFCQKLQDLFLLLRGYTVKATVRDPNDPKKVEHLYKLEGAKERLKLIKADLLEEGSFDSAVEGCEGVFHTASPCFNEANDPQIELIDPALKGTLNVLKSCAKSSSVKRVVLTSSSATATCNRRPKSPEIVVDETWFSDIDFSKECKWLAFERGAETFPNLTFGWINVKDVANAHIQAFEISSANGRYLLTESVAHFSDIVKILHQLYPTLQLPQRCANDKPFLPRYQISKEKAKTLGIEFISLEVSLEETVESLKEKKFVHI
ncbi:UDP-glycosyltransferase 79B30-like [Senna tora]|uniref:UDP-glycosyltransferase 79B30-like n=1 Tax=Senna tora TaxID=362788 RepID=A0A834WWN7_9FABA|nr:UDP-glycosyltransferase 79B30-like [Senna tora]